MAPTMTPVRAYLLQRGLFARIAKKLKVSPSYVSRVANGERRNENISQALDEELGKIYAAMGKSKRKSSKKWTPMFDLRGTDALPIIGASLNSWNQFCRQQSLVQ